MSTQLHEISVTADFGALPRPCAAGETMMRRSAYVSAKGFGDKAAAAGRFEIYTSELATRYARSAGVERFARQMIAENLQTEREFASILEKAAIEPPIEALDIAYSVRLVPLPGFGRGGDFDES